MDYEDDMRAAAHAAVRGVNRAIKSLATGLVRREDDLSGVLKGNLDAELDGRIGHLTWQCAIVDHGSGRAALEREFGADILLHVSFNTPTIRYSKGVLVQAKKQEPGVLMSPARHTELVRQCNTMLKYTPAAFVFDYYDTGLRCGSAALISGSDNLNLYDQCAWTAYRFFFELFRCPIGDTGIDTARPEDLRAKVAVSLAATNMLDLPVHT